MQYKLALLALSSLSAVLVAANPLKARKDTFLCDAGSTLQCCELEEPNNKMLEDFSALLSGHTGLIGRNCNATVQAVDKDDTCQDNNDIACCPTTQPSTEFNVGCTAMDD